MRDGGNYGTQYSVANDKSTYTYAHNIYHNRCSWNLNYACMIEVQILSVEMAQC